MRKILPLTIVGLCCVVFWPRQASALDMSMSPKPKFGYTDASGKRQSVQIIDKYHPKKIVHPFAKIDKNIDPKLCRAATIAQERAHAHSRSRCWQYVKEALLASGVIGSYPKTAYAKEAGQELVSSYGFKKLAVHDPFGAMVKVVEPVTSQLLLLASNAVAV